MMLIPLLSLVNFILMIADVSASFAFSLTSPYFIYGFGLVMEEELGMTSIIYIGYAVSILIIGAFAAFYFLSKKHIWPIVGSVILFALDCLVLIYLIMSAPEDIANFIIDIGFHIWAMSSLIILLVTRIKAEKLAKEQQPEAAQQTQQYYDTVNK